MPKVTELTDEAFRRWVQKRLKALEELIDGQYEQIGTYQSATTEVSDEANDRAARAQRAVRRLKKEFDEHEHE